jgi:hypothetical protein
MSWLLLSVVMLPPNVAYGILAPFRLRDSIPLGRRPAGLHDPGHRLARFCVTSIVLAAGVCLFVNADAYRQLGARRRMVLSGIELYRANPEANSPMVDPGVERLFPEEKSADQAILNRAIQEHIYTLPPAHDPR